MKTRLSTNILLLHSLLFVSLALFSSCNPSPEIVQPEPKALVADPKAITLTGASNSTFTLRLNCGCEFTPYSLSSIGEAAITIDSSALKTTASIYTMKVSFTPGSLAPGSYVHQFVFAAPDLGVNNQPIKTLYDTVTVTGIVP